MVFMPVLVLVPVSSFESGYTGTLAIGSSVSPNVSLSVRPGVEHTIVEYHDALIHNSTHQHEPSP